MTLTILASVSLLALVSSARPLPKLDSDDGWNALQLSDADAQAQTPSELEYTIQAVVKSHSSAPEALDDEDISVQLASVQDVQAYLAHADDNSVKALVHLDPEALHSADEREMYETLHRLEMERGRRTPVPDDVLDRSPASLASSPRKLGSSPLASVLETEEQNDVWFGVFLGDAVPTPVVVMVGACILSLLALGCVATVLYTAEILKKSVFRSDAAWGVLGKLETSGRRRAGMDAGLEHEKVGVREKRHLLTAPPPVFRIGRMDAEKPADDDDGTADVAETETDETFFDAEWADNASDSAKSTPYATPLVHALDLPQPPQPSHNSNAASYETTDTGMSELALALALPGALPSPSRPPWSLRASESKIHPDQAGLTPPAPTHPRTRRPYKAHAELDAALAMQLRPGLGLGADAAWLVRFVMAVFGWCAVLITSTNGAAPRRRGAA